MKKISMFCVLIVIGCFIVFNVSYSEVILSGNIGLTRNFSSFDSDISGKYLSPQIEISNNDSLINAVISYHHHSLYLKENEYNDYTFNYSVNYDLLLIGLKFYVSKFSGMFFQPQIGKLFCNNNNDIAGRFAVGYDYPKFDNVHFSIIIGMFTYDFDYSFVDVGIGIRFAL